MSALFLALGFAFILAVLLLAITLVRAGARERGPRLIVCPETAKSEAVEVDAVRAAWVAVGAAERVRLASCSRWPERQDCPQQCLDQIEEAPDGCLVRTRLARWYEDSNCSLCGASIGEVRWFDHRPGLLGPNREIREWDDLAPKELPETLATHRPLCWDCEEAESFRSRYPDLVLDDPWHTATRPRNSRPGVA